MGDRAYAHEIRAILSEAEEVLGVDSYAEVLEEVAEEVSERQGELDDDDNED